MLVPHEEYFIGQLVVINGVGQKLVPYGLEGPDASDAEPSVEVDGKVGRCLLFDDVLGKPVVQLLNASYVAVAANHLKEFIPPKPEVGGFDLVWPSGMPDDSGPTSTEALPLLADIMAEAISEKGWCLLQMISDDETREEAVDQATRLPFNTPKVELKQDYLGRGGSGKISILEHQGLHGLHLAGEDFPWALSDYDQELTQLAKAMVPFTTDVLGFKSCGRRKGMVHMPFADATEEEDLTPEVLTEEDADAGVVEAHIKFIRQRKLCFMRWIDNDGGELTLFPREDIFSDLDPIRMPITPGKLLVFRCDLMSYSYQPKGTNAVSLTTWIMDDSLDISKLGIDNVMGDPALRSEALGIMVGPPVPVGWRMHIMTIHVYSSGGVRDEAGFKCLLSTGCDGFVKIPIERFDTDVYCSQAEIRDYSKSYVIHSSMAPTSNLVLFDNDFFGISDEEMRHVGPNQRMALTEGYVTLHKAGFTKKTLRGRNMGVTMGDTGCDWDFIESVPWADTPTMKPSKAGVLFGNFRATPYIEMGTRAVATASRLSYCMGLTGMATQIDTACSASLVGVAVLTQGLRRAEGNQLPANTGDGHTRMSDALGTGASCPCSPSAFIGLCGPNMLSKKGRCFTYDSHAEGYARGDGYGGIYIKASAEEEDTKNQIACLIGSAVNQDGRSATLTAPNGVAQQQCIRQSMLDAGVVASQITIAECHGTGTALGDPIEVGSLRGVMEPRETVLYATSAKSNIGHTECAAGLIGLLKEVLMVSLSQSYPNIHLLILNPHLDVDGFPVTFCTEVSETGLNSNYAGVSSFGFSGTNARADVWGQCRTGPRKCSKIDYDMIDQVHTRCPVTLGPIEHLTGEPVTESFRMKKKYKADVLREEWAPYDISRLALDGGFRFRREPPPECQDEDLDFDSSVNICGSWSGFTRMDEMERQGGGWYAANITLGEGRYELFHFSIDGRSDKKIYPTVNNAHNKIWIEGPNADGNGKNWIIDGRDTEVPEGTVYQIRFRWHSEVMSVRWSRVDYDSKDDTLEHQHSYSLTGSFATKTFHAMTPISGKDGVWEGSFRLGNSGEEEFQIVRDSDWNQLIYPAMPKTVATMVPVRGPDHMGDGKCWLVRGPVGDVVTITLRITDGRINVSTSSEVKGKRRWENITGWDRHQYHVLGSFNGGQPLTMVMDPDEPGVFKAFAKTGLEMWACDNFQIVVDEDTGPKAHTFYPTDDCASTGQSITLGPDNKSEGRSWLMNGPGLDARAEITLDLNALDRRKTVTWTWMPQVDEMLVNGSAFDERDE